MEFIIDFYKELDTLNLIIFWGIIIVIILLLIFAIIMINKNKKLKKMVNTVNKYEEEIPIKKEEINKEEIIVREELPTEELINKSSETTENVEVLKTETTEQNKPEILEVQNTNEKKDYNQTKTIEMPTGPYQRNVLREMSLSQTSPIGINRKDVDYTQKKELVQDLEESLTVENTDDIFPQQEEKGIISNQTEKNDEIKQELKTIDNIDNRDTRKTEVQEEILLDKQDITDSTEPKQEETIQHKDKEYSKKEQNAEELLNNIAKISEKKTTTQPNQTYLEAVSKKLAEAEVPDQVDRTDYELQQEEDAIISYKELMEKKDSIQTIDEEDAVISIEELMQRTNTQQTNNDEIIEESKLYNLTEQEETDNFIKELKQFRNDL